MKWNSSIALLLVFVLVFSVYSVQGIAGNATAQKGSSKIPVIILFKEKTDSNDENFVQSNGVEIKQKYSIINGFAATVPQDKIEKLKSNHKVLSVDPDLEVHALDLTADRQIRADQVWLKPDTGTGVPVAILDTGIYQSHSEFAGRILKCRSEVSTEPTCDDLNGHGSHVAGIVGATGVDANVKGVAPEVSFYIDKVLDGTGSGAISGIISAIDWVRTSTDAKIISMSLGTNALATSQPNCDGSIPSLTAAINNAVAADISVVAAAGNAGSAGVGAPGCISSTIAVGAVDSADHLASFSSVGGPLADHGVVAPGVNIYSTYSPGYAVLSGTSMATPHVSGTIALMLRANPSLSTASVKSVLYTTACTQTTIPSCPTGTVPNNSYGHGRIDVLAAYNSAQPTRPTPPQNLMATTGDTQVTLSWTAPASSGGTTITNYNIYRGTSGLESLLSTIGNVLTYTDAGLTNGQTYYYTVTAVNSIGESPASNEASATPNPPPPDFGLSSALSSVTIKKGGSENAEITVTSLNGFVDPVALSSSLPNGDSGIVTAFNPASLGAPYPGQSFLTINVPVNYAGSNTFLLTVKGTSSGSPGISHTVIITVNVADFTVSASPTSLKISKGSSASSTITVNNIGNFNSQVTLQTSSLPAGVAATFTPTTVGSSFPAKSTLKLTVPSTYAGPRTFTLFVTGTCVDIPALSHTSQAITVSIRGNQN